jgi:hypothetical protein
LGIFDNGEIMSNILKIIPYEEGYKSFINIVPASEFVPEWYRTTSPNIPGSNTELRPYKPSITTSTFKKCTPFFDALTAGYMVFLNADIEVTRQDNGLPYIMYRTQREVVSEHSLDQWQGLIVPDGYSQTVYKWENPFSLRTMKNYSLLFTNPMNRFDLPFITISGLVDTDTYELPVNFPFFIKNNFTGIIKKGTPITQIIPIKRESWKRKIFDLDLKYTREASEKYFSTIKRSYKNNHWVKKEYK